MSEYAFRGTPFHNGTQPLNQTTFWFGWGPYVVPDVYTDIHTEMDAIRNKVSMNEMTPIPKARIAGKDAKQLLDWLMPRNIMKMEAGYAWYNAWCNDKGKVVGDGIVFMLSEEEIIISSDYNLQHFRANAKDFDVEITDVTDDYGILALQGPKSQQVLEAVTGEDWSDLAFCRICHTTIAGVDLHVARQGFTGEHGYELWVKREGDNGKKVWDAVYEAGQPFEIQPAGEYAIDVARVEAGLILISADYASGSPDDELCAHVSLDPSQQVTPYELGLAHCVNLNAGDFVGKQALLEEKERGTARGMVGLELDLQNIVDLYMAQSKVPNVSERVRWDALTITKEGNAIGRATSVTWSYTDKRMIAFACLENEYTDEGTKLTVQWKDFWGKEMGDVKAKVVSTPFIDLNRN